MIPAKQENQRHVGFPLPPCARRSGFTLIELLVVVSIIGVLIVVLVPALGHARQCALITGELSAARQFMTAHRMYSSDHRDWVMPGYPSARMMQTGAVVAKDREGNAVLGLEGRRYPLRMLPYLDYTLGILYVDAERIEETFEGLAYTYAVSVAPRMGLNQAFVGGSADSDGTGLAFRDNTAQEARLTSAWGPKWYVKRASDPPRPSHLIAFASAYGSDPIGGLSLDGMYRVTPPYFRDRRWSTMRPNEASVPSATGNVAMRYLNKAVAAMMDGHAESLTWEQLQDMRRWAPGATTPDWTLPSL